MFAPSHEPALASRGTFLPLSYYIAPATVTWGASTLTVAAGGAATLGVTIAPDGTLPHWETWTSPVVTIDRP